MSVKQEKDFSPEDSEIVRMKLEALLKNSFVRRIFEEQLLNMTSRRIAAHQNRPFLGQEIEPERRITQNQLACIIYQGKLYRAETEMENHHDVSQKFKMDEDARDTTTGEVFFLVNSPPVPIIYFYYPPDNEDIDSLKKQGYLLVDGKSVI